MSISTHLLYASGLLNGAAAVFWLGFICFWTYTYAQAQQARNRLRGSRFFYLSAFLYQAIAFFNFAAYSIAIFSSWPAALIIADISALMYIPMAYFVGMSCSAGFGTLYMRVHGKQLCLSIATLAAGFAGLLFWSFKILLPAMIICSVILLAQVAATVHTWWRLRYLHKHYNALGYSAHSVNLQQSLSRFCCMVPFITLSFAFIVGELIYEFATALSLDPEKALGLKIGFMVTTTMGNCCVLLLMRPRHALADVPEMAERLSCSNFS